MLFVDYNGKKIVLERWIQKSYPISFSSRAS